MFPSETIALLLVGCARRAFVKWWVLPYLARHVPSDDVADLKVYISEEISSEPCPWIARDTVLIETWQMIRAVKQRKVQALNFNDRNRRLE